jgi:hypothetical protein
MSRSFLVLSVGLLIACPEPDPDPIQSPSPDTSADTSADTSDTGASGDTGEPSDGVERVAWTILVFMNGDNDLESAIWDDLNELEAIGSNEDVHVLVQVDRHESYWSGDGDWTDARRYYIDHDTDDDRLASTLIESLGEVDMGDPSVLSDFLLWAEQNYPAERIALSMWNHGDGWSVQGESPPPFISWDMTDNGWMSFAAGHFNEALDPWVAERGLVDIVGFDACSMASWEVAHTLRDRAEYMVGSETVVGMDGFHYTEIIHALQADPDMSTQAVADLFAWSAGDYNEEWTFSVTDISKIDALSQTIDELAASVLTDPDLQTALLDARARARGADSTWQDYYLDLGDLADVLSDSDEATLSAHGDAIGSALSAAVPHNYTRAPYAWTQGLTIYSDLDWTYLADYVDGSGATWAQETRWDDLLVELAGPRTD